MMNSVRFSDADEDIAWFFIDGKRFSSVFWRDFIFDQISDIECCTSSLCYSDIFVISEEAIGNLFFFAVWIEFSTFALIRLFDKLSGVVSCVLTEWDDLAFCKRTIFCKEQRLYKFPRWINADGIKCLCGHCRSELSNLFFFEAISFYDVIVISNRFGFAWT